MNQGPLGAGQKRLRSLPLRPWQAVKCLHLEFAFHGSHHWRDRKRREGELVGALTLGGSGNATIDFGNGASSQLSFASAGTTAWTGTLSVLNWSGNRGSGGGGTDPFLFGSSANHSSITAGNVSFYSGQAATAGSFLGTGSFVNGGSELVPVPEPHRPRRSHRPLRPDRPAPPPVGAWMPGVRNFEGIGDLPSPGIQVSSQEHAIQGSTKSQRQSWSHIPTTAPTEPNAASPKNSAPTHLMVCGDVAALTGAWSGIPGPNGHLPAKAAMEVGPGATHPWQIIAA